jgi:hypothetical protein
VRKISGIIFCLVLSQIIYILLAMKLLHLKQMFFLNLTQFILKLRVRIQEKNGTLVSQGSTNASGVYQDTAYSYGGDVDLEVVARKSSSADNPRYRNSVATGTITTAGLTVSITMIRDNIVT